MIPQRQLHSDAVNGDCFRACMCSILEIPNTEDLPNVDDDKWVWRWNELLRPFGIVMEWDPKRIWRAGYWIADVPSKNFGRGVTHAIVMKGHEVAFDPSLGKRYRAGLDLLGTKLVLGGHYFVVDDPSLLRPIADARWNRVAYDYLTTPVPSAVPPVPSAVSVGER